jgi:peptide/nickel transport system substrate-binding protein
VLDFGHQHGGSPQLSNELEFLSHRVAAGKLSRRDFLGRAAALGVTATFAGTLLTNAAYAAAPRRAER